MQPGFFVFISSIISYRSLSASLSELPLPDDAEKVYFNNDLFIFFKEPTLPKSSKPCSLSKSKIRSTATFVSAQTKIFVSLSFSYSSKWQMNIMIETNK